MPRRVVLAASSLTLLLGCDPKAGSTDTPGGEGAAGDAAGDAVAAAGPHEDPKPVASQDEHDFSILDMLDMQRIGDPQVSPDGKTVAFSLRTTDLEANKGLTDLWLVDVAGGEPRRLTKTAENEGNARWSADGKSLYYLARRGEESGIFRVSAEGGEPETVRTFPLAPSGMVVAPGDAGFVLFFDVFRDCEGLQCTADRLSAMGQNPRTGVGYDRMFVRHWDTWKDGRRSHAFFVPAGDGAPRDLTGSLDADVPSKPFGGPEEVVFTPDGKSIVFGARVQGAKEPWSTNYDLYVVPVDGSGGPRNLTEKNLAWDTHPVFSPDGKTLAYAAMKRPGYEADRFSLMVRAWPDGEAREVTGDWDRSVGGITFAADGKSVFVTAQHLGQVALFSVGLEKGDVTPLIEEGTLGAPQLAGDRLVFTRNDLATPDELHTAKLDGSDPKAITSINADRLKRVRQGAFEQFSFKGAKGDTVYGYVVKPVGFDEKKKYPIAFLIHGGPQGSFGNRFHYRWNPQAYAGAGYAAIMIDFHGSTGYGQKFTDAIGKDWGGKPLQDLKKGLKAATDRYPWLDGDNACALGASYGGYMINWIAGNWSDGFKCLVNHDGVFDMRSMYYSTEELWFPEWEQGGPYFEAEKQHEKHNPVRHVKKWKTPMLVVHGSQDHRVPLEQGLAAFTALQRQGIESRFLHFPDENHWVLQPNNSIQWHEEVLGWLGRFLK